MFGTNNKLQRIYTCHTLLCLKWITNKDPIEYRDLCSVLCGSRDGRGVWGRRDTCICMVESLCCPPKTITTTLLIVSTPISNKSITKILPKTNGYTHVFLISSTPLEIVNSFPFITPTKKKISKSCIFPGNCILV